MSIEKFVSFCQRIQPQSQQDISRFFESVVFFPYDNELLLQAFLFLNIKKFFPLCTDLLLFEKALNGENTDQGKCDFVYLTAQGVLFLIETKFIDTQATEPTERKRRNKHRGKVFEQVLFLRSQLSENWDIPIEKLKCGVFTTDTDSNLNFRGNISGVLTKKIPISYLKEWSKNKRKDLLINDSRDLADNETNGDFEDEELSCTVSTREYLDIIGLEDFPDYGWAPGDDDD